MFALLFSGNVVYRHCWEDAAGTREASRLGPGDRVPVSTSAGCNALDGVADCPPAERHRVARCPG